jgi:hypothetical protein
MRNLIFFFLLTLMANSAFSQIDDANKIISSNKTEDMKSALEKSAKRFISFKDRYGNHLQTIDTLIGADQVESRFGPEIFTKRFTQNLTYKKKCFLKKRKVDCELTTYNYLTFVYPDPEGARVQPNAIPKETFQKGARFVIARSRKGTYIIYLPE